ncbi:hypothetical protein EB077_11790, partial [bacterium]|nr:hypothetical protein [bacterium]NDG02805.1 hypothetical protein [Synechococcaceae bacterium WBB_34_004]
MKKYLLALAFVGLAGFAGAQGIQNYSSNAASNTAVAPYGWPTGMNPADVKLSARQMMADTRAWYDDAQWIDGGYGVGYVSPTGFQLTGNRVSIFTPSRRVKALFGSTNIYGTITSSSFGGTSTTVIIAPDS